MSNYYEKRDAKVRMSEELRKLGWKIYGYKPNESDSMTDYYSPANWDGIATKNGYTLVVDCSYSADEKEITRYNPNYINMSEADRNKINSLKNMTVTKGATNGEAENAQKLIEKINAKYEGQTESKYEVIGTIPAHLGNPNRAMWHIEKDGCLVDKGNALTFIANIPDSYEYDINTMQFTERYKKVWSWVNGERVEEERKLGEETLKDVKKFKALMLRFERIANCGNSCGDGTTETEKAYQEQNEAEKMVKKTFTKVKKVVKLKEIKRDNCLEVGDIVNCTSGACRITEVEENLYRSVKIGSKRGGYKDSKKIMWTLNKKSFDNSLLNGTLKVFNKVEVEEVTSEEKWVKEKVKKTVKQETAKTESAETMTTEKNITIECNVNFNKEKNGIELSFSEKPSQEVREILKSNGLRYSKFNILWYCKDTKEAREKLTSIGLLKEDIKTDIQEKTNNDTNTNVNKNVACDTGLKEEVAEMTINTDDINIDMDLEGLFDNIEIENNNRLNKEDQEKMNQFDEILKDLQKNGQKYIDFYRENKLYNYSSRSENNKEEVKISIWSFEENFVQKVLFKEIENLINNVIYYFKEKYNVKLEYKEHSKDYSLDSRIAKAEENFKYFMNIAIDDILNDIFEEMGGMSFNDKALDESKSVIINSCKRCTDVRGINVNVADFLYYDSFYTQYGNYQNRHEEKIIHLFKLVSYENTGELVNNYEYITKPLNSHDNKFIGEYEINDSILKSFKTFKNGKVQLKFNSGSQALSFAKKYLGYQE